MEISVQEQLWLLLSQIPEGRFTTYGRLAAMLPGVHARQVARILSQLPEGTQLPWHRVVNSQFKVSDFHGSGEQSERLRTEGLLVSASGRLPKDKVWPDSVL
ncbi:MGMT family protein [Oceanospirillum sediminis]|uniref:MGMT family protein n=1 Tax=Oceanospirillum sediminis TaxID=2760088 RepID=A0A839IN87_9GAMM|nr:MGMT family protein [Oceanospirillum sediminis]MBB1486408.1 MGMT family protein [Oceanospirillum sediminis]